MLVAAAVGRVQLLPVMMAASLLFVLVNVTSERLIGSWLEKIFAKRRARELLVGLFVLSMVSMNFLNLAMQHWGGRGSRPRILHLVAYFSWLPGSLAGNAVAAASDADTAVFGAYGGWITGMVGGSQRIAVDSVPGAVPGGELSESAAPSAGKRGPRRRSVSLGLPGFLSPPVAGVMRKEFHYLTRNGFSFLALIIPPIMVIFFTMEFAGNNSQIRNTGYLRNFSSRQRWLT